MAAPLLYGIGKNFYDAGKSVYSAYQNAQNAAKNQGQVLGASTTTNPAMGSSSSRSYSSSGLSLPATGTGAQINAGSYDQAIPGFQEPNYDAMIAPALEQLDQAIAPAQQQYQDTLGLIDRSRQTGISGQQSALAEAQKAAELSKGRNTQTTEAGVNEQRRGLSELQQGLQARYGGSTGTGKFVGEIAGSKTLSNIGQMRQNLSQVVQEIDNNVEKVRSVTQLAIQDIEDQATEQKLNAKSQLDQVLNQIRTAKGELLGKKQELAANAIQLYQQTVNKISADNAAFKQKFALQQASAEQKLAAARQKATSTISGIRDQFNVQVIGRQPGQDLFGTPTPVYGLVGQKTGTIRPIDINNMSSFQNPQMGGQLGYETETEEEDYLSQLGF